MVLRRNSNLLMCLATPGSASGSTSVCPWLWSGEMLPAYWPVCEFDLTLPVVSCSTLLETWKNPSGALLVCAVIIISLRLSREYALLKSFWYYLFNEQIDSTLFIQAVFKCGLFICLMRQNRPYIFLYLFLGRLLLLHSS